MRITLSPTRSDSPLTALCTGETLVLNGTPFDFSDLTEGEVRPAAEYGSDHLVGSVTRKEGRIALTLILPYGPGAPEETLFPALLDLTEDGPVPLPPFSA